MKDSFGVHSRGCYRKRVTGERLGVPVQSFNVNTPWPRKHFLIKILPEIDCWVLMKSETQQRHDGNNEPNKQALVQSGLRSSWRGYVPFCAVSHSLNSRLLDPKEDCEAKGGTLHWPITLYLWLKRWSTRFWMHSSNYSANHKATFRVNIGKIIGTSSRYP